MLPLFLAVLLSSGPGLAPDNPVSAEKKPLRLDLLGDPLPAGATARLGTERLRLSSDVAAVAFSPDGKVLASGGRDATVRLWDPDGGKELLRMTADAEITRIAFTPDSKALAAATNSGKTIFLWDTTTGKELQTFRGHTTLVHGLAISPDGKTLASTGWDSTVRFWDLATGKEIARAQVAAGGSFFTLAYAPDGKTVATGGGDRRGGGTLQIWDVATAKEVSSFKGHGGQVYAVVFSPNGKLLASAGGHPDQDVRLWDLATGKEIARLPGHKWDVRTLVFSPDGKTLASADLNGITRLWDVDKGKELLTLANCGHFLAFAPDGKTLAAVSPGSVIRLVDPTTGKDRFALGRHEGAVQFLAFSADGKSLATHDGKSVRLWDAASGKLVKQVEDSNAFNLGRALTPDGKILATVTQDFTVHYWDTATGKETASFPAKEPTNSLAFSPNGKVLALGGMQVRLWQTGTDKELGRIEQVGYRLLFAPDGRTLALGTNHVLRDRRPGPGGDETGSISLVDVSSGKEIFRVAEDGLFLAFSPDGHILVSASGQKLHGWEIATGKKFFTFPLPEIGLNSLAFSSDGRLVATGSYKGAVHLWDVATGKEAAQLAGHSTAVRSLAFSPDGKVLASGSEDTTALLWDVAEAAGKLALPAKDLAAKELEKLWLDLGDADGGAAYPALWSLAAGGDKAVAFLGEHVETPPPADTKRIRTLVANLDSDRFEVREAASLELKKIGPEARAVLEEALKGGPSAEARKRVVELLDTLPNAPLDMAVLRGVRTVQVLELIGSEDAKKLLKRLADGPAGARIPQEARWALEILNKRAQIAP